ncbi:MAG: response regulator transcription factor [Rhodocyclaceae bacterium]|nr:MAG: response regulator transcription factor [Rhodocyclaceae bacterium]
MKCLIVDDHPLIREGVAQLFRQRRDLAVVHAAGDAAEALLCLNAHSYDIVIMDINLPDQSGIELVRHLREARQTMPVLMLSMLPEAGLALRCIKAGADGYVSKESPPDELMEAVRKLLCGRKHFSPEVLFKAAQVAGRSLHDAGHERLSDREFQVMCMLATGKSITLIAHSLQLSPNTVSTYRARILDKLGIESNAELTRFALQHGLV